MEVSRRSFFGLLLVIGAGQAGCLKPGDRVVYKTVWAKGLEKEFGSGFVLSEDQWGLDIQEEKTGKKLWIQRWKVVSRESAWRRLVRNFIP